MQFEKIRTIDKRKIIIGGVISLGVISALIYLPSRAKYRTTESFNIVNGTINYKVPDLNVVAMYTVDEENNEESISTIPTDDSNYTYTLNTSKSACTVDGEKISSTIGLENGSLTFKGITEKGTKCSVYFDKVKVPEGITSSDMVVNAKTESPNFKKLATTDEGIYTIEDGMYGGISYYWRGAVENNYVKFADLCWRIIRINGDGSIRMLYDGTSCHANGTETDESIAVLNQKYNTNIDRTEYVGYTYTIGQQRPNDNTTATASNIKVQTDDWYNINIGNNAEWDSKVEHGKFCNDREMSPEYTWSSQPIENLHYAGYDRFYDSLGPTLSCLKEDIYLLKAGAITADEINLSGGITGHPNTSYYLYNGQSYWSMTPFDWRDGNSQYRKTVLYFAGKSVSLSLAGIDTPQGIRPVINLRADTQFEKGTDGTLNNPYVVQ